MTNKDKIRSINDIDRTSDADKFPGEFKKTMDNVTLTQERRDAIRADLISQTTKKRSGSRSIRIARYAAIAAAVCAVLLCIPATRTTVSAAIDYLKQTFHLANGGEVTYEENSEGNSLTFSMMTDDDNGYTKVENGRLYFVLGDTQEDITDKCSSDKYFRHEIKNDDGSRSIILIGGTPESCGWAELFFDKNGKYIFNNMNVDDYNDPWLDKALNAEGVDSGNPYLDEQLTSEDSESGTDEISETSGDNSDMAGSVSGSQNNSPDTTGAASEGQTDGTITSITIGNKDIPDNSASSETSYIQQ